MKRRSFLQNIPLAGIGLATGLPLTGGSQTPSPQRRRAPVLHVADCFHPHGDPDDHFDLACEYALSHLGHIDLRGIVIDYPPHFRAGDPAVMAVAQLNWMTAQAVPVAIGTSHRLTTSTDKMEGADKRELAGVQFILRQLRQSEQPLSIICVGSAADVIVAALREPELFRSKCAGVYLNSGAAYDQPAKPEVLEFNVKLDKAAYAAMFKLPCPLYWFPCWHTVETRVSGTEGTFFKMPHKEALSEVSQELANYFQFMFDRGWNPKWLRAMNTAPDAAAWAATLGRTREMWSTASQFIVAGLTVTRDGAIVPIDQAGDAAIFRMRPVEVICKDSGHTTWHYQEKETGIWKLSITDANLYPAAMTKAIATLLKSL